MGMYRYVGVDGCKAGWFAVQIWEDGAWQPSIHETIADLWRSLSGARLILIDIPIGLVDWGAKDRSCDRDARRLLGWPRSSSVFTPPVRFALYEPTREVASTRNQEVGGRKLTIQAWHITPKIREVDQLLRSNRAARDRIRETHPELLFWALNGRKAMTYSRKRKSGFAERLAVLRAVFSQADAVVNHTKQSSPDGTVCLVVRSRSDVLKP
jgi:predicted RNase H-like nuclease